MAREKVKFLGLAVGTIIAILAIIFFIMSLKIASKIFIYVIGSILIILIIGFVVYYIWKFFNKMGTDN